MASITAVWVEVQASQPLLRGSRYCPEDHEGPALPFCNVNLAGAFGWHTSLQSGEGRNTGSLPAHPLLTQVKARPHRFSVMWAAAFSGYFLKLFWFVRLPPFLVLWLKRADFCSSLFWSASVDTIASFSHEWMLSFIKPFFCLCWDDTWFFLPVTVVNYISFLK